MSRTRRLVTTGVVAAAALATGGLLWGALRLPTGAVQVERGDLVVEVEVSGTLRAVESSVLMPPQVQNVWQFKIAMLADEGTRVSLGEPVLAFDTSELEQRLQTRRADLDTARAEVEKKRVDLAVAVANDTLALAEVEARLRKARLLTEQPPDLRSGIEVAKARLDLELAEVEVGLVTRRIDATRRAGAEELAVLEAELARVASEVQQIEQAIGRMTRTAPREGIVIHVTDWRNEKMKVGDSCWAADPVLEIPDLSRMAADGEVEEARAGRLREGQQVLLRLDAHPDRQYRGAVESISRTVQQKSWRNPVKIVRLAIALEETDPERMRPGMRFRGSIEVDRRSDATLVPLEAVRFVDGSPVVFRQGLTGWRTVAVRLGERGDDRIEVLEGLEPGDVVSVASPS
ncbi:MAG TPA: HlyD family efflux transporter periplasmic adaptor subunit [Candidatus Sulfomarinibacteraceae bacterium]|nr:HlyD family efflux transporter periplasmic adaptor subunit [Candidatus Sulfomarinibacteraceae bacterium]